MSVCAATSDPHSTYNIEWLPNLVWQNEYRPTVFAQLHSMNSTIWTRYSCNLYIWQTWTYFCKWTTTLECLQDKSEIHDMLDFLL